MSLFRFLVVIVLLAAGHLRAQTLFTLRDVRPRSNGINVVFLAEGYTAAERAKFQSDAAIKLAVLLGNEAWSRFAADLNAFAIYVESAESGADDPSTGTVRNTYFDSTYGTAGIDRLLTINNYDKAYSLLAKFVPDYDVVIVIVNATKYGGAGGSFAVTSMNSASDEVMLHELGHSFANLADEYEDPALASSDVTAEFINATQKTKRALIPWTRFIAATTPIPTASAPDENTVGLFLGAFYRATGFYRPTYNSKMRSLGRPFGPVNLRAFADAVHRLNLNAATAVPTITQPPRSSIAGDGQRYELSVEASGPGPLTYQWVFNGVFVATGTETTLVLPAVGAAQSGTYVVEVTNARGTTVSSDAIVTARSQATAPAITGLSATTLAATGGSFTLTASVSGSPPFTYQWLKNGIPITGATNSTLAFSSVATTDAGSYSVVVTNDIASRTSAVSTVTVATAPSVSGLPATALAATGESFTLTASVSGSPPFTYQWLKNGIPITGATDSVLAFSSVTPTDTGSYSLVVSNVVGSRTSAVSAVTVASIPSIKGLPEAVQATVGQSFTVTATMSGASPFTYQWLKNGIPIMGATSSILTFTNVTTADAGSYSIVVTNAVGSRTSAECAVTVAEIARISNFSIRAAAGTGSETLIVGFVIGGNAGTKPLLIRGIGPALVDFGVPDALADPKAEVYDSGARKIAENDNWSGSAVLLTAASAVGAFPLTVPTSKDAAISMPQMSNGGYSVHISGVGGETGIALAEIYDATPASAFSGALPRLINVSARTFSGTDAQVAIVGFVIAGRPKQVLIRAIGPTLVGYGVTGVLANPMLELYDASTKIDENDNWSGTTALKSAFSAVGAFPLDDASKDSALVATLAPGLYSAKASGVSGTTGVVLIEVYEMP